MNRSGIYLVKKMNRMNRRSALRYDKLEKQGKQDKLHKQDIRERYFRFDKLDRRKSGMIRERYVAQIG